VAGLVARSSAGPREVKADDRMAADRDADLEEWVLDETVVLRRRLASVRAGLAARGALYSGDYGYQIGLEKEKSLQAYRDQERQAARDVARIFDREGWLHTVWRVCVRQRRYELVAHLRVEPVVNVWRSPPTKHLSSADKPAPIDDPTQRTLERTRAEVASAADAFE
jgi:hypothetical protein